MIQKILIPALCNASPHQETELEIIYRNMMKSIIYRAMEKLQIVFYGNIQLRTHVVFVKKSFRQGYRY